MIYPNRRSCKRPCAEVLEARRLLTAAPQAVVLANQLVTAFSSPNNTYYNTYSYNAPTVTWSGLNGATTYYNSSDCSSFQEELMMQAYGFSLTQLETWTKVSTNGITYPQASDLYTAALDHDGFTGFLQIADLQIGDDMFMKYIEGDGSGDTGHCVMVDALPTPDAAYSTSTYKAYDLTVVDCTVDPHSNDTRTGTESGVGRGTMRIYTTLSGNLFEYSWGLSSSSVVYNFSERPAIFSKMPAASGNTFLAAGSQATWSSSNDTLAITGPAAIIADPGSSQQPAVTLNSSADQLLIMPGINSIIHLASLTMTNGSTTVVYDPDPTGNLLLDIAANVGDGVVSIDSTSQLDLQSNDMIVHGGNLSAVNSLIAQGYNAAGGGNWKGTGITSTTAAADSTHLTALGAILNTNGTNTLYTTFDGVSAASSDVLVRHTYFGDTNLDGKVDGSDYSRIDNGALHANTLTGWYNGDFNYDGIINGSDYTLIDNTYNTQGSQLIFTPSSQIAKPSATAAHPATPNAIWSNTAITGSSDTDNETIKKRKWVFA